MATLHVVYRSSGGKWQAYSRPAGVYASGRTLEHARDQFHLAAEFHFGDEWPDVGVLEHLEREVVSGVFVRTAIDRSTLDREQAARVLRASLALPAQLQDLEQSALLASTGDVVFIACVAADRLDWIIEQLGRHDALQVCVVVGEQFVWWTALAAPGAEGLSTDSETLAEAGLAGPDATVQDLMLAAGRDTLPEAVGNDKGAPPLYAGRQLIAA